MGSAMGSAGQSSWGRAMGRLTWKGFVPDSDPRYSEGITLVIGPALNAPVVNVAKTKTPKTKHNTRKPASSQPGRY